MIKITSLFVAFLMYLAISSALAAACSNQDNTVRSDGECWLTLHPSQKDVAIRAIWSGIASEEASLSISGFVGKDSFMKWIPFAVDWLSVPLQTTTFDIVTYFDELYSSPANRAINWSNAYLLAALKMRDDEAEDRLALVRFFREHSRLPKEVTITRALSADTFEAMIEGESSSIEVNFAGLTEKSVPAEVQQRTKAFIDAISLKNRSCRTFGDSLPKVTLQFRDDLFDNNGRLSAYVSISFAESACAGKDGIYLHKIFERLSPDWPDGALSLNEFLLRAGLLARDTSIDAGWSDERRDIRKFWLGRESDAEERKLYMYGSGTLPEVELIGLDIHE